MEGAEGQPAWAMLAQVDGVLGTVKPHRVHVTPEASFDRRCYQSYG